MKKHSILFLLSNFRSGGAETQYGNLISNIDRDRFIPVLGLVHYQDNVPSQDFLARFGDAELHSFVRRSKLDMGVIFSIAAFIRENNVDLIQSLLFMDNQIARFSGLLSSVPVVTSIRGEIGPLIGPRKMWFEFKTQWLSKKIVVNSHWLGRYLLKHGSKEQKIVAIHNGIDFSRFTCDEDRGRLRQRYDIPDSHQVITIVARLHEMKDHVTFLKAIHIISKTLPELTVLVLGDGDERKKLEVYAEQLKISNIVRFMGNVTSGIEELYRITDLLMLTSKWGESFPNVLLEAMTSGVPVLASDISAVDEIIDDGVNGFTVPSGEADAFADKALKILGDPSLKEAFIHSARLKSARFGIPEMVGRYEALYLQILGTV